MSRRITIVGEDPGRGDPDLPLLPLPEGSTGSRLKDLMCLSLGDYLAIPRVNVYRTTPVRGARTVESARRSAARLAPLLGGVAQPPHRAPIVVALGRRVLDALGAPALPWLSARLVKIGGHHMAWVVALPHPSGRNRWYNEPVNVRRAILCLRASLSCAAAMPSDEGRVCRVGGADIEELIATLDQVPAPVVTPPRAVCGDGGRDERWEADVWLARLRLSAADAKDVLRMIRDGVYDPSGCLAQAVRGTVDAVVAPV